MSVRRGVPGIFVDSSLDTSITRRHAIAASFRCLIRAGADEDEDDDFLSPEMRERLKALDAETAPPVDKCPIQHDLGDDDALKCSKDWVNAIVSDAGICPFSLSADRAGLPLGDVRYDVSTCVKIKSNFQAPHAIDATTSLTGCFPHR